MSNVMKAINQHPSWAICRQGSAPCLSGERATAARPYPSPAGGRVGARWPVRELAGTGRAGYSWITMNYHAKAVQLSASAVSTGALAATSLSSS